MLTRLIEIGYIMHHVKYAVSVCRSRIILSDNSKLFAYDNEAALWSHHCRPPAAAPCTITFGAHAQLTTIPNYTHETGSYETRLLF
jgi:hypothetical protein